MKIDVRTIGSGNIGTTNVLRTGNKILAATTLILDALKGYLPVLTALNIGSTNTWLPSIVALSALLGHLFPVWLKFKGGKGVATLLGILLALSWPTALTLAAVWLICAKLTRISSLSALIATILLPLTLWLYEGTQEMILFGTFTAVLIMGVHHENIKRLLRGQESKFGQSK